MTPVRVAGAMAVALLGCSSSDSAVVSSGEQSSPPKSGCVAFAAGEWTPAAVGAATFVVDPGTRGMSARVRWALAPDSSAIIAVEDPSGVEAEAVPDGVLFASERTGRTWRMDSVWSASPSPDWRQVAVGRAVVLGGGEAQSIAPSRWEAPAARLEAIAGAQPELAAESLRAHSYPVSGMAVVEGAAATFVAEVSRDVREAPVRFVTLDGWRVRWSCDGRDLMVGVRPVRVQDDAPAGSERRVAVDGGVTGSARAADSVSWTSGPTLDISTPVERGTRRLNVRGRVIAERDGRIVVVDSGRAPRDVGPGMLLAATRSGRFILAIVPRPAAKSYESPDQAVVYRVP